MWSVGQGPYFFFLIWMYNVPVPFFLKLSFVPGGPVVKNLPANAGGVSLIPGLGRSLEGGNDNPLQYSCWDNPMDRGAWRDAVYRVTKSPTRLSDWAHMHALYLFIFLLLVNGPTYDLCLCVQVLIHFKFHNRFLYIWWQ